MKNIKTGQRTISDLIREDLAKQHPTDAEKLSYALNSGKRLRSIIIWSLSHNTHFSLFIEYIHTASLIIDDLPCMDNDLERRGCPAFHVKYGEHSAQLTAYNLTMLAMKHLELGVRGLRHKIKPELIDLATDEVYKNLGGDGIGRGQLLDLEIGQVPKRRQRELIMEIIKLKTGCLFSISFLLGWLDKGASVVELKAMAEAGHQFGIAYQIIDDLKDYESDKVKNGAVNNIKTYYSRNEIVELFTDAMEKFSVFITGNNIWNPILIELYKYILASFKSNI